MNTIDSIETLKNKERTKKKSAIVQKYNSHLQRDSPFTLTPFVDCSSDDEHTPHSHNIGIDWTIFAC